MESHRQTIRRLRRELKEKDRTIDSLRRLRDTEEGLWGVTKEGDMHVTDVPLLHTREVVDDILSDGCKLATVTSFGPDKFEHIYGRFVPGSERRRGAPLFSEDRTPNPGNRCLQDRKSALLLALLRKRHGLTQDLWSGPLSRRPILAIIYAHFSPPIICLFPDTAPASHCCHSSANSDGVMYPSAEWILSWL